MSSVQLDQFKQTVCSQTAADSDVYIYQTYSNSYIHSHTDGGGCHAQPAHQGQFGVQYLAQGHFGMQTQTG